MTDEGPTLRRVDFDPFAPVEEREVRLPLTEAQREMWTAAAMSSEANCAYNQCFAFTFDGSLRVDSLRHALDQVVARHEALRAVMSPDGTEQSLRAPFPLDVPLIDLASAEPEARAQHIRRILEDESTTPFDLAAGPLIRALIVRESQTRHVLVLTVHHIVCDGWSSSVLFADVGRLYAADCVGIPARLDDPVPYRQYVTDLTAEAHAAVTFADEDYWVEQFADGAPVLELPLSRARPPLKTYPMGRQELRVGPELYSEIRAMGTKAGATLFATLLAALEVVVYRLTGQDDFVVGIPLAGQLDLENPLLVAHCVNTVPLRARVNPDAPFAAHARSVRTSLADAQRHGSVTFGTLVRRLGVPRDLSRTPLVQMTFTTDRIGAPFDFGDIRISGIETPKKYSNFELAFNAIDDGSSFVIECDYNTDLFDATTIRRWLSHYDHVLHAVVAEPDMPVGAVPLVGEAELAGLIGPAVPGSPGAGGCLHERFATRVDEGPDRVAVSCEGESWSYLQLDRKANAVAERLQELGVGPDVLVGLRTERSPALVLGILGILKAGGAYVPLDPAYPRERVDFMLADSKVSVVVTEQAFAEDFANVSLLLLDDDSLGEEEQAPVSTATPESLAYVIYTSGSTGVPKGVLISHRNVTRLFDETQQWFDFGEEDVWSLFHSYAFDFSVWELWGALLYGGRVVVVPYWVSRSPEAFRELVLAESVTVLNQTPSAFRQYIAADIQTAELDAGALRYVIFGGEALELTSLTPWFERHGDLRPQLVNMYGITETTVHVTYRPLTIADLEAGAGSVIGRPIPDLRLLLLDDRRRPVPVGVAGELYVGGSGVSRGYLDRPELTAERFIDDPFHEGSILYRTGDLARRLEDGDLEYLGRIDDQVKIRGFRIELGEIEAVLVRHPAISDAAVVARQDHGQTKTLVAYIVTSATAGNDDLRAHLRRMLPDYMVPSHFVTLDRLPLTGNGKLDLNALPAPGDSERTPDRPHTPPRTATEQALTAVWAGILGTSSLGVDDNFFDLGGDSMKAAQIVTALRLELGVDAGMRHLFERPTIAALAEMIDALALSTAGSQGSGDGKREKIEI